MAACDGFTTRGGTTAENRTPNPILTRKPSAACVTHRRYVSVPTSRTVRHGCGRFPTHETPAVGVGSWLVESHESACPRYTALCWRGDAALACEPQPPVAPGRPPVWRREHKQRFWGAIGRGLSREEAAAVASVSSAVGVRWFREGGGMSTVSTAPLSGRYLSFGEREDIAILHAQDCGVRKIARRLGRAPSTISRELRHNAATGGGNFRYRATTAQWHADRRAKRPKVAKLAANGALRHYVQEHLAGTLKAPNGTDMPATASMYPSADVGCGSAPWKSLVR